MTTTTISLTPSLPSSFQLASDEVHSWCASPKLTDSELIARALTHALPGDHGPAP